MTLTSWSHAWSKSGNISTRCSSKKRSGSGVRVFQLAFEHTEDILNTYFSYVWYLYRCTLWQSYVCAVAYTGHFCFWGVLTKPSISTLKPNLNKICQRLLYPYIYGYSKRWQILFKFGNLFEIRHCIVGPELLKSDIWHATLTLLCYRLHRIQSGIGTNADLKLGARSAGKKICSRFRKPYRPGSTYGHGVM